jgi:hypothetical protein
MGAGFHGGFGNTQGNKDQHTSYLREILPKRSPITIPPTATIKEETKNGYQQVKYSWKRGEYSYISRWHTRTPNAPVGQGNSWVVQRDSAGKGYGTDAHPAKHEIMVGKGKWVPRKEWNAAIYARKHGTATQQQKEMLDHGHWKDE